MKNAIRKRGKDFAAIVFLVVLSGAVGAYVLSQERFRFPFFSDQPFQLKAELATAQAVTPGQGQSVRVSGIQIGELSTVGLEHGRAVVTMDIEPKYRGLVHTDAHALLRPKTGLKDMFVEIDPGSRRAPAAQPGWTIPVANTLPDVNPDEILAVLDADTRDYLRLLIHGGAEGLNGRGADLADVFRRFEPTHRDLARVNSAVATRRVNLRRLIHSLQLLNTELAGKREQISQLVDASAAVFRSLAAEQGNVSRAVRLLPGALRQTTATLGKVQRFAQALGPTAAHLIPAAQAIAPANRAVAPFAREAAPILERRIRPFVRDARPLVRNLRPASRNLATATPNLQKSFVVLNHLFNTLSYNPKGRESASNPARQEGYLYWIAWLNHQALTLFSSADANGSFRPLFLTASCPTFKQIVADNPGLGFVGNLVPLFDNKLVCGGPQGGGLLGLPIPGIPKLPQVAGVPGLGGGG